MATNSRAKRKAKKRPTSAKVGKPTKSIREPIAAARADFLEFLKKADPGAPELGGKREGAGRPSEGKKKYTISLTEKTVDEARKKTDNLSGVLDGLLTGWLKKH